MTPTKLDQSGLGSLDWAGGTAPSGGVHTGQTKLTMIDGSTYFVAHSVAEVRAKIGTANPIPDRLFENFLGPGLEPGPGVIFGPVLVGTPNWVAFDVAGTLAGSLVLNVDEIAGIAHAKRSPVTFP